MCVYTCNVLEIIKLSTETAYGYPLMENKTKQKTGCENTCKEMNYIHPHIVFLKQEWP